MNTYLLKLVFSKCAWSLALILTILPYMCYVYMYIRIDIFGHYTVYTSSSFLLLVLH